MKLNVKDYPVAFINKILNILKRARVIKKIYRFTYNGKGISLNQFYNNNNWWTRKKLVDEYHKIFDDLIFDEVKEKNVKKYSILIFYNSRHDPDNVIGMEKVFVDVLRGKSGRKPIIKDDSKRYCKFVGIIPDLSFEMDTFEFVLIFH